MICRMSYANFETGNFSLEAYRAPLNRLLYGIVYTRVGVPVRKSKLIIDTEFRHSRCKNEWFNGWNLTRSLWIKIWWSGNCHDDHVKAVWHGTWTSQTFLWLFEIFEAGKRSFLPRDHQSTSILPRPPPGSIRDKIVIFANLPLFTNDEITLVKEPCSNCIIMPWKVVLKCTSVH